MKWNELERQRVKRQNFWQEVKQAKLHLFLNYFHTHFIVKLSFGGCSKRTVSWRNHLTTSYHFCVFLCSLLFILFHLSDLVFHQRKETLPVSKIQSVKAVRKGIRDIPRAFEIFTDDQTYVFKAKGQQNVEQWVQCLHIAVVRSHMNSAHERPSLWGSSSLPMRPVSVVSNTKL